MFIWLLLLTSYAFAIEVNLDYAVEGSKWTLPCTGAGLVKFWLLHGEGEALVPGREYSELRLKVDNDGSIAFQELVVDLHEGEHICVRQNGDSQQAHKIVLQMRRLPSTNPWEDRYKSRFITGFIAALVIASIFTLTCLVHKYRWRSEDRAPLVVVVEKGQDNPALDIEDGVIHKAYPEIEQDRL